jgi:hypothetical protein
MIQILLYDRLQIIYHMILETDDFFDTKRPHVEPGANTYRKARGGMSLASGYLTPTSRKNGSYTPISKLSLTSEYTEANTQKQGTDIDASTYYNTPRSKGAGSRSPQKKVFCKSVCVPESPSLNKLPWLFNKNKTATQFYKQSITDS